MKRMIQALLKRYVGGLVSVVATAAVRAGEPPEIANIFPDYPGMAAVGQRGRRMKPPLAIGLPVVCALLPAAVPTRAATNHPAASWLLPAARDVQLGGPLDEAYSRGVNRLALPPYDSPVYLRSDFSFETDRAFVNYSGDTRFLDMAERQIWNHYAMNRTANGGYGHHTFVADAEGPLLMKPQFTEAVWCCTFHARSQSFLHLAPWEGTERKAAAACVFDLIAVPEGKPGTKPRAS